MEEKAEIFRWRFVTLISLGLIAALVVLWSRYDCCKLGDEVAPVNSFADVVEVLGEAESDGLFRLTTGIFVQSLDFQSASDVQVTGRIWQRTPPGRSVPESSSLGVLFPDAITQHDSNLDHIYQDFELNDGSILNVWNFQVVLRQYFDYNHYPLDGKLVWIRFWTQDVENQIQLVPDLGAYANTSPGSSTGISKSLVTGEWSVVESFFGYKRLSYGTDFGRNTGGAGVGSKIRPELRFYVMLQRNSTDAFLVNLVPLLVTFGLMFGLMMSVTRNQDQADRLGFNTLAVFGSCAGLFFIVLVGHIQLRQEFAGSQIVYIEYFYIISYVALLIVSIFSFTITSGVNARKSWFLRDDGINMKLAFWPVLLFIILALSYVLLFRDATNFG